MLSERLKSRLVKDRPMTTITLRILWTWWSR